jgi:type IV pilus assembly protein PilA
MKQMQQGFTLIELMIVVAIIGILAAVAVPQYQNYTVRGQVTEGLAMASEFKTAASEFRAARGFFPDDNVDGGLGNANYGGNYVTSINLSAGAPDDPDAPALITITYGDRANAAITDTTLGLRGGVNASGGVVWACGYAAAPTAAAAVPDIAAAAATTIAATFLPTDCRS